MEPSEKKWRIELAAMVLSHSESISTDTTKDAFDIVETLIAEAGKRYDTKPEHVTEQATQPLVKRWTDPDTGLVWHVEPDWRGTHYEAVEKFGDALPNVEELKEFEKHGGRKALGIASGWCWSSTIDPNNIEHAVYFTWNGGILRFDARDSDGAALLVRRK